MKLFSQIVISVSMMGIMTIATTSLAQTTDSAQQAAPNESSTMARKAGDNTFAMKAAQGGMAEVELGNLAVQKAANPDVKHFGQLMVDDHGKANDQLKQVAGKTGISLPSDVSAKDKALKSRLEKLAGEQFDRAYMEAMLKDHRTDVSEFQKEADHGSNPDLKSFASSTLPTLHEHLKMAQDTMSKLKGGKQGSASRQQ